MIVVGDRPTFWFATLMSFTPCGFLVLVGLFGGLLSAATDVRAFTAAIGLGGSLVLLPFVLRLCCRVGEQRLTIFTSFRPSPVPIADIESISAEPFGGGSRIAARMRDGIVHTLILTPNPWWVSQAVHEFRVGVAVEQLREAVTTGA